MAKLDQRSGHRKQPAFHTAVCAVMVFGATAAHAILIDFESYATGELVGKPATGTKWGGTAGNFLIASGVGKDGGRCIQQAPTAVSTQSNTFSPAAGDLGLTSFDTNLTYVCSFDVHLADSNLTTGSLIDFWIGRLSGASTCARIGLRGDGKVVNTYPSLTLNNVLWSGETSTGWVHFDTKLDFRQRVFTLWINGAEKWSNIPFNGTAHTTTFGSITLNVQTGQAAFNTLRIDNLKLDLWRDPPTLLLIR